MKLRKHTIPDDNVQVQKKVVDRTGIRPCIWQIKVVCKVLEGVDVITIAATGSGKSLCYWMALLHVRYGIVFLVTPLKLLRKQFVETLERNKLHAVLPPMLQVSCSRYMAHNSARLSNL